MKKRILTLLLAAVMILSLSGTVFAANSINVLVGGEKLKTDVAAFVVNNRVMLPLRAVFEAIGAEVNYIASEQKVVATKGDRTVELVIGSNIMKINGEEKTLDVPAMVVNNRTLVPVRACAEAFLLTVGYVNNTNTVRIKKPVSLISEDSYGYKYTYDENGNLIYREDSYGNWEKYSYDTDDYLIYQEDNYGNWIKYTYDDNGNLIYQVSDDDFWKKYTYDDNNNLIFEENSNGSCEKNTYDEKNNLIYQESSGGSWTKYTYDTNNNLIYQESSGEYWVKYAYDKNGNLILREDSETLSLKYVYDEHNNVISREDSNDGHNKEGIPWVYTIEYKNTYDENGNLIYREDCDGSSWEKYVVIVK